MTAINGMVACGKRGGPTFLETVRVDSVLMTCPEGYEPCSVETSPSETICMPLGSDMSECPILDLVIFNE